MEKAKRYIQRTAGSLVLLGGLGGPVYSGIDQLRVTTAEPIKDLVVAFLGLGVMCVGGYIYHRGSSAKEPVMEELGSGIREVGEEVKSFFGADTSGK